MKKLNELYSSFSFFCIFAAKFTIQLKNTINEELIDDIPLVGYNGRRRIVRTEQTD
jgi:hypothetical protein